MANAEQGQKPIVSNGTWRSALRGLRDSLGPDQRRLLLTECTADATSTVALPYLATHAETPTAPIRRAAFPRTRPHLASSCNFHAAGTGASNSCTAFHGCLHHTNQRSTNRRRLRPPNHASSRRGLLSSAGRGDPPSQRPRPQLDRKLFSGQAYLSRFFVFLRRFRPQRFHNLTPILFNFAVAALLTL